MISVIVCARNPDLARVLKANIDKTIGVPYELILYDNSIRNDGICQVYNREGARAMYPIICFVHEDVAFKTPEWGKRILNHFKEENMGVLGIAGGDAMSRVPSTWSNVFFSKSMHLIQYDQRQRRAALVRIPDHATYNRKKVLTVDGVFMCVRKCVFDMYRFDEHLLKGFHGYDMDYSFQLSIHYTNYVIYDVLLEHFSPGQHSRAWFESTLQVAGKWKKRLPASIYTLDNGQWETYHWQSLHLMINRMYELRYHPASIYFYGLSYSMNKYLSVRRFLSMNRLFFQLLLKPVKKVQL